MHLRWLPFQLLDIDPQDAAEEEGANVDLDSQRKGKCAVIKTSTRQVSMFNVDYILADVWYVVIRECGSYVTYASWVFKFMITVSGSLPLALLMDWGNIMCVANDMPHAATCYITCLFGTYF